VLAVMAGIQKEDKINGNAMKQSPMNIVIIRKTKNVKNHPKRRPPPHRLQ